MRKAIGIGSALLAVAMATTGCSASHSPEKAFQNAASERMDIFIELLEIAENHQEGDSKKAVEAAHDWADRYNEFQADFLCAAERSSTSAQAAALFVQTSQPSEIPSENKRDELQEKNDNAIKDVKKSDSSTDDEAYVTSNGDEFAELFDTGEVKLVKEGENWKVCEESFQLM